MTYLTTDPRVPQVCAALRGQWLVAEQEAKRDE
jgi:hypothetical protein